MYIYSHTSVYDVSIELPAVNSSVYTIITIDVVNDNSFPLSGPQDDLIALGCLRCVCFLQARRVVGSPRMTSLPATLIHHFLRSSKYLINVTLKNYDARQEQFPTHITIILYY